MNTPLHVPLSPAHDNEAPALRGQQQLAHPALLRAEGLVKRYGGVPVVNGLDLSCVAGEVLGLLGPNGAGKTTTLGLLYGLKTPDAGTITFRGTPMRAQMDAVKREIGVCTQDDTLDHDLTVAQNLAVYAGYFRPHVHPLRERVEEVLGRFGLTQWAQDPPRVLSGGYKRRLLIARSMVHRPSLLFLDEPTTGLDPQARLEVWQLIDQLRDEGMGIVLTTHYMDEAERLCDRLLIMRNGRGIAEGPTHTVIGDLLGEYVLVVEEPDEDLPQWEASLDAWAQGHGLPYVMPVLEERRLAMSAKHLADFQQSFPDAKHHLRAPTLEDLFLQLSIVQGRVESTDVEDRGRSSGGREGAAGHREGKQ